MDESALKLPIFQTLWYTFDLFPRNFVACSKPPTTNIIIVITSYPMTQLRNQVEPNINKVAKLIKFILSFSFRFFWIWIRFLYRSRKSFLTEMENKRRPTQIYDKSISARKYASFLSSVTKTRTSVHKFFCQMIKLLALVLSMPVKFTIALFH